MHLQLVEDLTIPTLAVDGRHIFYNPNWVLQQSARRTQSGFVHEIMHCVCEHHLRRNGREPTRWNYAGDYVINIVIKDAGFELSETWLYDEKYRDMSTEHVYDLLKPEENDKRPTFDEVLDGATSAGDAAEKALEWEIAVQSAAQMAKAYGKLPKGMERFMEEMGEPQVPWQAVLQRFINQTSRNDYSWSRPSKRMIAHGYIMPSLYSENMGVLATGIDTSGSIDGPTLTAFGSEITAAFNASHPEKLINIYCDAKVAHVDEVDQGSGMPPFKAHGGGGTDFRPPFDWLEEHDVTPACMIYLTDGYGPFPEEQPDYPVLWCMTTHVVPPWGEHVRIKV
jgi:predicted metal-dependent peptidase